MPHYTYRFEPEPIEITISAFDEDDAESKLEDLVSDYEIPAPSPNEFTLVETSDDLQDV